MRWVFLWVSAVVVVVTPLPVLAQQQEARYTRPNIVFAFADDWGRYASAYAEEDRPTLNDVIDTPNFDALAEAGVLFWDAHVSNPSCTPSRTAVLTGRHFYQNGSGSQLRSNWSGNRNNDPLRGLVSYHQLLHQAGYHTGVTYKSHVLGHLFVGRSNHYNQAGREANTFSQLVMEGQTPEQREAITQRLLDEVRANMTRFLDAREEGQPFCWFFSPTNVHRPWIWESGTQMWGIDPDDLEGRLPAFLPDNAIVRQDMADYLGECMAFDAQLGVILDELRERDLLDNTLIVVSGDHGAPGFPRGKCNLYSFGTQVPLLVHWPGRLPNPGRRIDNPVSLIDLAPTFLEAAGLDVHPQMTGRSLMPMLNNADAHGLVEGTHASVITGRERHGDSARDNCLPYPSRAIRTADYLYIRNFMPDRWPVLTPPLDQGTENRGDDIDGGPTKQWYAENQDDPRYARFIDLAWGLRPEHELYDLRNDPDQMVNLAEDRDHAGVLLHLSSQLIQTLNETGDPRVVGNDAFDRPPYLLAEPRR